MEQFPHTEMSEEALKARYRELIATADLKHREPRKSQIELEMASIVFELVAINNEQAHL